MARVGKIKNAKKFVDDGAWVYPIPNCFDVKVRTKGLFNSAAQLAYNEARLSVSEEEWNDKEFQDELNLRILCEHVLVDWANIEDDEGEEIPFSAAAAKELLSDPDMVYLRAGFMWAADNVGARGRENIEEATKN